MGGPRSSGFTPHELSGTVTPSSHSLRLPRCWQLLRAARSADTAAIRNAAHPPPAHPTVAGEILWENMDRRATSLWNGLRGGLIVPAVNMSFDGLNAESMLKPWKARGADEPLIKGQDYVAYELRGQYEFSIGENDRTKNNLRRKVRFLVEDSPSLKLTMNPEAAINTYHLSLLSG